MRRDWILFKTPDGRNNFIWQPHLTEHFDIRIEFWELVWPLTSHCLTDWLTWLSYVRVLRLTSIKKYYGGQIPVKLTETTTMDVTLWRDFGLLETIPVSDPIHTYDIHYDFYDENPWRTFSYWSWIYRLGRKRKKKDGNYKYILSSYHLGRIAQFIVISLLFIVEYCWPLF